MMKRRLFAGLLALILPTIAVSAEPAALTSGDDGREVSPPTPELVSLLVKLDIDSGLRRNDAREERVVFTHDLVLHDTEWIRLKFTRTTLPIDPRGGASYLRITSLTDGGTQILTAESLWQWQETSAYFNGDALRIELIAAPGATARVGVDLAFIGEAIPARRGGMFAIASQCGPVDDRVLSQDPRSARVLPVGCTVFMIDDFNNQFLTAGHCASGNNLQVVQFNVPLSGGNGGLQHPPPEDQYAVDPVSVQFTNGGIANDWCYFGVFPNSVTGLSAVEAQGDHYLLAQVAPPVQGQMIRITGYGTDNTPPQHNQVQQTHAGPYVSNSALRLRYQTDTTGGNSGSAVQDDSTGLVIGIHTHGGCNTNGTGSNSGTAIEHSALQFALANPRGVCAPQISFTFPEGFPSLLAPAGGTGLILIIEGAGPAEPVPGTAMLHLSDGLNAQSIPLFELGNGVYEAVFPAAGCGAVIAYSFSVETVGTTVFTYPTSPDLRPLYVPVGDAIDTAFADNFETHQGWFVTNSASLTDGAWERGVPVGGGVRGDPPTDADGSGQCYLTANRAGDSDVDNGWTRLTSPRLNASSGAAIISYHRWYSNTFGAAPEADIFEVEVSDDDGATWQVLEIVGPTGPEVNGSWFYREFALGNLVANNDQFRIRFIASDLGQGSVVEAGVDGVSLRTVTCSTTDITGFSVTFGQFEGGTIDSLREIDEDRLRVRSRFGFTALEPNLMIVELTAQTTASNPEHLSATITASTNQAGGTATFSLRDHATSLFVTIEQHPVGTGEETRAWSELDATRFVHPEGRIDARLKHSMIATFTALGFESRINQARFDVP